MTHLNDYPIYVQAIVGAILPLAFVAASYVRSALGIPPSKREALRIMERQQAKRMRDSLRPR